MKSRRVPCSGHRTGAICLGTFGRRSRGMRIRQAVGALMVAGVVVGMAALPAAAGDPTISLRAVRTTIDIGGTFRLSGQIPPWHTGETIRIVGPGGAPLAQPTH